MVLAKWQIISVELLMKKGWWSYIRFVSARENT